MSSNNSDNLKEVASTIAHELKTNPGVVNQAIDVQGSPDSEQPCCSKQSADDTTFDVNGKGNALPCGCEESGQRCGCRGLQSVDKVEPEKTTIFESWHRIKCMFLLILVVIIVAWIVIFTSLCVTKNICG